jgi:hypothetical protein
MEAMRPGPDPHRQPPVVLACQQTLGDRKRVDERLERRGEWASTRDPSWVAAAA